MKILPQVLLVEGRDDEHVVYSLAKHYDLPQVFSVKGENGIENILKAVPVRVKGSGVVTVGVLMDADVDIANRWASLSNILKEIGYSNLPEKPSKKGTIVKEDGLPGFGVWIMPDNSLPGMLEDFIAFLVPDEDKLYDLATKVVSEIPAEERKFIAAHTPKATIHTWLAWQPDPGTPLGLAITKKYLDADADQALVFRDWLLELFGS